MAIRLFYTIKHCHNFNYCYIAFKILPNNIITLDVVMYQKYILQGSLKNIRNFLTKNKVSLYIAKISQEKYIHFFFKFITRYLDLLRNYENISNVNYKIPEINR